MKSRRQMGRAYRRRFLFRDSANTAFAEQAGIKHVLAAVPLDLASRLPIEPSAGTKASVSTLDRFARERPLQTRGSSSTTPTGPANAGAAV
jgi:hypothetical protein